MSDYSQGELFEGLDQRRIFILFPKQKLAILKNDYWQSEAALALCREKDWLRNETDVPSVYETDDNVRSMGYCIIIPQNQTKIFIRKTPVPKDTFHVIEIVEM